MGETFQSCSLLAGSAFSRDAMIFILPNSPWFKILSRKKNCWETRIERTWVSNCWEMMFPDWFFYILFWKGMITIRKMSTIWLFQTKFDNSVVSIGGHFWGSSRRSLRLSAPSSKCCSHPLAPAPVLNSVERRQKMFVGTSVDWMTSVCAKLRKTSIWIKCIYYTKNFCSAIKCM